MRGDNLISRSWSTGFLLFIIKQDKVTIVAGQDKRDNHVVGEELLKPRRGLEVHPSTRNQF